MEKQTSSSLPTIINIPKSSTAANKQQQLILDSLYRTQHIVQESHKAIQEYSKRLGNYCAEGNVDAILTFYDSDIELLESQTPTCRGIDALRLYYETVKKLNLMPDERSTMELHTLSPFIVLERGKYKIKKSKKQHMEGRYFSLWINRSDWRIIQECRNLST